MEHQSNTNMYQSPPSPPPSPPLIRLQAVPPEVSSNMPPEVPVSRPPASTDIDQSLSSSLLSLNLSRNHHDDRHNPYGVIGSPINPRFDSWFDLDLNSYLLVKELVYSTHTPRQSLLHNNNIIMPNNNNISRNYRGVSVSNTLQTVGRMTLQELKRMIVILAKDQNGCKILRSKLENPAQEDIEIVLFEVVGSLADLMKDQFGNYIIQKLICVCNDDQRALIVHKLTESSLEFIQVCMSLYGTRAVQKLLENLKSPHLVMRIIRALHPGVAHLANDPNGHHVLRYCLLHYDTDMNQLILDKIAHNCFRVASNRSGCCVMQACVEHSGSEVVSRLVAEIMAYAIQIAEDPYGNYVLQHMLGLKLPGIIQLLVRQLEGNFASLSQNKFASNVVERCLIESRPETSTKIVLELVGSSNPSSLLVDPYGNFVIQSALKVSKGVALECLIKLISRNLMSMQSNLYGKKILQMVEKMRIRAHLRF